MNLAQLLASRNRTPSARVTLNGQRMQVANDSGSINISGSFGQPIRGGSIKLLNLPFIPIPKMPVTVEWGFNGLNVPAFTGVVTNPNRASYPKSVTLQVKDILWLADYAIEEGTDPDDTSGMFFGNNKTADEVMHALLETWAGIPASRINIGPFEKSPGVPWILGTLTPIKFGGSPLQACLQICDALGLWLFCDNSGIVRTLQISGAPTSYPIVTWKAGIDLLTDGAPTVSSDIDQVYNQVMVTGAASGVEGAQVRDFYRVDSTLLPEGVDRTFTYNNPMVEFVNEVDGGLVSCTKIAERMVREHSREPYTLSTKVKAIPDAQVGWTVALQDPRIGLRSPRKFFLMAVNTSFGGGVFEQSVTLDGGIGPAGYTLIPPPFATFTWRLMSETFTDVDGNTTDMIEVFVDGTSSRPMGGGEIVSWSWVCDVGTPLTGSGPYFVFLVDGTLYAEMTITLTVTDVTSKSNSFTQIVPLVGDFGEVPAKRAINFAGTGWYLTPDGGKTWHYDVARKALAVPPIGNQGSAESTDRTFADTLGLMATGGTTAARIRSTADYLKTPAVFLTNPPGIVNFIWQNERDPKRIWVAVGGSVHLSVNGGVSWGPSKTPGPFPEAEPDTNVRWVVEAFDNLGVIDVLAGRYCFTSFDGGDHWITSLEGPAGSIARCYVSGFKKHWVGFTGMIGASSPVRSVEGDIVAFPAVTPPVDDVMAITLMAQTPDLYMFDKQGRIWRCDADSGDNCVFKLNMPD